MAKINFNLKSPRSENSLIILRYRLPKGRLNYSTGISIPTRFWNPKKQVIRSTDEFSEGKKYQVRLDEIDAAVKAVEGKFYREGIQPSVAGFKVKLDEELMDSSISDIKEFIAAFISERSSSANFRPQSIKVYKTLRNHFLKYLKGKTLHLQDLNLEILQGFLRYLQKHDYSDNHVHKMMSTLKTMLNDAADQGYYKSAVHKHKKLRVSRRDADNIYLNQSEIQLIYDLDLASQPGLESTRDLFVIGCYTGLRYSDFIKLVPENLIDLSKGKKAFRVIAYKTSEIVWIPLHPIVHEILDKYDFVLPSGNVNQVMNRQLKEIARLAGIDSVYQKRIYRSGNAQIISKHKYEFVCTHTARRSFASNAYKAKIPVPSIMKITGHKKTETFLKYISLSEQEHAELMSENPFFN